MNKTLLSDLIEIVNDKTIPFADLCGKNVLVTGATGLIGSMIVRTLSYYNKTFNKEKINILAFIRDQKKADSIFCELNDVTYVIGDITDEAAFRSIKADYIIHCAGVTKSKTMVENPVETIYTSINGLRNVLEFAKNTGVLRVLYLSSMEMYGSFKEGHGKTKEDDIGYINPLTVRSDYPESKRMCENICVAYKKEYNVDTVIARPAQTFGAGILKDENRVFAQFVKSAINGEDIVLHTMGKSQVNFCYTADMVRALILLLIKGEGGQAYNIADENSHTTVAGMAQLVAEKISETPIKVVFDIPKSNIFGYAADTVLYLDTKLLYDLGFKTKVGLEEAFLRLSAYIKEENAGEKI